MGSKELEKRYEKYRLQREGGPATEKQMDYLEAHSMFTRLEIYKMSKAEASKHIGIIEKERKWRDGERVDDGQE